MNYEIVITLVLGVSAAFLGWKQWQSGSRVQDADAVTKIGNAYDGLLNRLGTRIGELEMRVTYLENELKTYSNWSARLIKQLIEHGIEPVRMETDPKMKALEK